MRGILINPHTKTITEVQVKPGLSGLYEAMRADPAFSGTVELVRLTPSVDLWIDEEGNLSEGRPVFEFAGNHFTGCALILGADGQGGSCALRHHITIRLVELGVKWTTLISTGDFGPSRTEDNQDGFVFVGGAPVYQTAPEPVDNDATPLT